jgi:hypothetical protein
VESQRHKVHETVNRNFLNVFLGVLRDLCGFNFCIHIKFSKIHTSWHQFGPPDDC